MNILMREQTITFFTKVHFWFFFFSKSCLKVGGAAYTRVRLIHKFLRYLNRRIVYSSGHQGTFNPAVITNKEVHVVHGNINTNDETSHTTSNAKKRSLKISDYFSKQNGKPSLSGE